LVVNHLFVVEKPRTCECESRVAATKAPFSASQRQVGGRAGTGLVAFQWTAQCRKEPTGRSQTSFTPVEKREICTGLPRFSKSTIQAMHWNTLLNLICCGYFRLFYN